MESKNRKIGIITFHASYNCGSMLQAYALQQVLRDKFRTDSEILDFSNKEQKRMYSILYRPRNIKDFLRNIYNMFFYVKIKKHNNDYIKFSEEYLKTSEKKYSNLEQLENEKFDYSTFITGSDQVWNVKAHDFDDAYFLPFVNGKTKISYAVSLGATNINMIDNKQKYKEYIKELDAVSVREKNAQKWISELTGKDVNICLDPTLLLSRQEWEQIVPEEKVKGKYIFWYCMTYKKRERKIIEQISKKYNMPVYILDAKEWSRRGLFMHGIRLAKNGGPLSYLSLVKNADLVITSSFHGTVFCNIFQKNFWYLNVHDGHSSDDRASFLLSQLGLSDRYVSKDEIVKIDLSRKPEYENTVVFDDLKKQSLCFLEKNCNLKG